MYSEVIGGILEDVRPGDVSGVVCDLFHPYHENGAVIFLVCDANGGVDGEGREEGL